MELAAELVESEPGVLLRLEAAVEVELGLRPGGRQGRERRQDDQEDRHDGDELDKRVTPLIVTAEGQRPGHHFRLLSTYARALRATRSLCAPKSQRFCSFSSIRMRMRSASAPSAQPKRAP